LLLLPLEPPLLPRLPAEPLLLPRLPPEPLELLEPLLKLLELLEPALALPLPELLEPPLPVALPILSEEACTEADTALPTLLTAPMQNKRTNEIRTAYSTAVGPSSRVRN